MADNSERRGQYAEHIVQIRRCACVVKGGRRFSFAALVVVGDGSGKIGLGYAKAPEVPIAVEKAVRAAERSVLRVRFRERGASKSVFHRAEAKYGASRVLLLPAGAGTGLIAGGVVRSVLNAAGYTDVLTKVRGSSNPLTLVRATVKALVGMRNREDALAMRGVSAADLGAN